MCFFIAQFQASYGKPLLAARDPKCSAKDAEAGVLAMEALHKQVMPVSRVNILRLLNFFSSVAFVQNFMVALFLIIYLYHVGYAILIAAYERGSPL